MRDLQHIRAQLRAEAGYKPGLPNMALPTIATLVVFAAAFGGVYYLSSKPSIVPLQPSAAIPTFQRVDPNGKTAQSVFVPQPGEVQVPNASQSATKYAGLSPRQIGKAADSVCFARAHARFPHWSKTPRLTTKSLNEFALDDMPHFNELLNCLLTEAPTRYCSTSQRSMITAEIAMYFRVLEYGNQGLAKLRADMVSGPGPGKLARTFAPDPAELNRINQLEFVADPRIIAAIEARLRDGTLTKADLETFSKAAAPPIQQRFADVKPSTPACPAQPWWAFWRTL